eukprot:4500315-Pyramimonas_sp.AAC.2
MPPPLTNRSRPRRGPCADDAERVHVRAISLWLSHVHVVAGDRSSQPPRALSLEPCRPLV